MYISDISIFQIFIQHTARKVSKYIVFSGRHFPVSVVNTEIYLVNLCIQSKYRKIRTRKSSVFGLFSRSGKAEKYSAPCQTSVLRK